MASHIKEMLFTFGFGYAWLAQDVGNSKLLLSLFSQRLNDCYFQDWLAKLNESPKAEHYKHLMNVMNGRKIACDRIEDVCFVVGLIDKGNAVL